MNAKSIELFIHQFIFTAIFLPLLCFSSETGTISSGLVIKDPDTIVSSKRVFKLGFFTPHNSANRYMAVFYAFSEKTVIWIANRDKPLNDFSSTVTLSEDGNLVLINGRNQTVWSTNATSTRMKTSVQIQDTGNLVLRDDATGTTIWQSFSHPSDVFMPTMNISHNINTGKKVILSAWKNATDPEVGIFTSGIEALNIPQHFIWNNGRPHRRSGPWKEEIFLGIQDMYHPFIKGFSRVKNDSAGTFYFTVTLKLLTNIVLNSSGSLVQALWDDQKKSWGTVWLAPENESDIYGRCGPFGSCNALDSPVCSCLRGFEPAHKDEWERGNWTSGCKRKNQLQCDTGGGGGNGDGFYRLQFMKVPDFAEPLSSRQEDECRTICLGNCSCIAYAHDSNIGCMFWSDSLIDIQKFDGVGVDLHIRLLASELDNNILEARQRFPSDSTVIVIKDEAEKVYIGESPSFTFEMLADATDQFHENNLLRRGGFGPVYKGTLANGKEIAVKKLAATSRQGVQEFMNEVTVISKLQQRNLVKLLGCCVEKEEKMLINEYMPNKSLDVCLFDPMHPSQKVLDWRKRFSIIEGIGRGLLYLHRDSRLQIIHRDLKPSNILLDRDWNPKISDFGMARIFGGNQDHGNTARVVGTYGYMSPEYAAEGRFSEKTDVYSFGVMMLEIVKGKKNRHYYNHEWSLSLLGCAWKLWIEDNGLAFADEGIANPDFEAEIVRCIQIALLCVQEFPKDRPTIQTILSMLSCEIVDLPAPKQPIFAEKWNDLTAETTQPGGVQVGSSINELSLSVLDGR